MRTRRRAKYTWFPNIGFQGEDPADDFSGFPFSVGIPTEPFSLGDPVITALIPDFNPSEPSSATDTLSDFIGNEYILKRIVGKIFAFISSANPTTDPTQCIFGLGFFVARVEETAPTTPIGSGAGNASVNYGVLNNANTREPWIWRRVWNLRNTDPGSTIPLGGGLANTVEGGSVMDGPHIDSKSSRRIRNDERLFMTAQCGNFRNATFGTAANVECFLDYRILGALRKAKNRSAF